MLIPLVLCSILACLHPAESFATTSTAATRPTTDPNATLATDATGLRRIKSATFGTYLRAYEDDVTVKMVTGPPMLWERWYIEELDGKVILKSFHDKDHFLSAYSNALVYLAGKNRTWETWTPLKNEDGTWSFQSVHGGWLSILDDGGLRTVDEIEAREHFWLEYWTGAAPSPSASTSDNSTSLAAQVSGRHKVMSVLHGTYLRAHKDVPKVTMVKGPTTNLEEWYIEDSHNGTVFFNAINAPDRFLRASQTRGVVDAVDRNRKWEKWTPFKNADGSWSFKSAHGLWLSARADGSVKSVKNLTSAENFWLEPWTETTYPCIFFPKDDLEAIQILANFTNIPQETNSTTTTTTSPITESSVPASPGEVVGNRRLKSVHGTYLRSMKPWWKVDMAKEDPKGRLDWIIKERNGKVVLQASPQRFLQADRDGFVKLDHDWDAWTPVKNADGSYSFQSVHGHWLSARDNGAVGAVDTKGLWEHFRLETWTAPTKVPTTKTPVTTTVSPTKATIEQAQSANFTLTTEPTTVETTTINMLAPPKVPSDPKEIIGRFTIRSASDMYLRADSDDWSVNVVEGPPRSWENWYIKAAGNGKVVFQSIHVPLRYLRAYPDSGKVDLSQQAGEWEKWTPFKNDDGSWTFKSAHGGWLRVLDDGLVYATETDECFGTEEKRATSRFRLEPWKASDMEELIGDNGGRRLIKAWNGKYLQAWINSDAHFIDGPPKESQQWYIEPRGDKVVIRSQNGQYLREYRTFWSCCWADLAPHAKEWELWTPVKNDDGTWSFLSHRDLWLSAHRKEETVETMPSKLGCEKFDIESW